jgi:acylphosphatase
MAEQRAAEVLHILVSGNVQGVGFREFTRSAAQRLGIAGWVRNLPGGEVEVLARIPASRKAAFLAQLRQGPGMSGVDDVIVTPAHAAADCPTTGFTVRL